ncbi:MAG: DUF1385 domain-containing protein [Lachnospiraceae bacterium]|nr:DUF1385 domain-containing protein [Lachnospiraceae bacterium]
MKSSGIGGQAVLEGIMMKNGTWYAVAVRKPDQTIEVKKEEYRGVSAGHRWMQKPFIRGVFNFIDSLILGMQTLTYSASFYEEEEETEESKKEGFLDRFLSPEKQESLLMAGTVVLAVVLAVGIFMILPMFCARFMERFIENSFVTALLEGVLRMAIFILYVWGISLMEDIRRTYMYHGAEHKCINCVEHGLPLTVENVRVSSKEHKRCGTSFMLFVMMISILVFMFLQMDNILLRMLSRIVFVPVIAGISYEILRLAGRSDGKLINAISKPGLMLQGLTTREPDDDMIEVAIQAVEAVFDWRAYEEENFGRADDAS